MANKKKLKKEIKLLRKRVKKAMARKFKAQKELDRMQARIARREQRAAALAASTGVESSFEQMPVPEAVEATEDMGFATAQRATWKKHTYLRDRYEAYLEEGRVKHNARRLANADLVAKYGEDSGFSEQDLEDILT